MGELLYIVTSLFRNILFGPWWAKLVSISIAGGLTSFIYVDFKRRKNKILAKKITGVGIIGELGVLHLIPKGIKQPQNISEHLRGFDSPGEIYTYVYEEFGEAIFKKIVIHKSDTETVDFVREESQSDEENKSRLSAIISEN